MVPGTSNEIMTIKLRYKKPDEEESKLISHPVIDEHVSIAATSDNFRFSAAVAEFGLLLRNSDYKQQGSYEQVINLAKASKGTDPNSYRAEFIRLVQAATSLVKN
jgi:Ca-activated chloride channel family protein